ncbi:hypothetical protein DFH27DRAFT_645297 [Peziza echinospora]|nr:hypothetical protein DFH27DRAFT_645297 [Peziza echinospora]
MYSDPDPEPEPDQNPCDWFKLRKIDSEDEIKIFCLECHRSFENHASGDVDCFSDNFEDEEDIPEGQFPAGLSQHEKRVHLEQIGVINLDFKFEEYDFSKVKDIDAILPYIFVASGLHGRKIIRNISESLPIAVTEELSSEALSASVDNNEIKPKIPNASSASDENPALSTHTDVTFSSDHISQTTPQNDLKNIPSDPSEERPALSHTSQPFLHLPEMSVALGKTDTSSDSNDGAATKRLQPGRAEMEPTGVESVQSEVLVKPDKSIAPSNLVFRPEHRSLDTVEWLPSIDALPDKEPEGDCEKPSHTQESNNLDSVGGEGHITTGEGIVGRREKGLVPEGEGDCQLPLTTDGIAKAEGGPVDGTEKSTGGEAEVEDGREQAKGMSEKASLSPVLVAGDGGGTVHDDDDVVQVDSSSGTDNAKNFDPSPPPDQAVTAEKGQSVITRPNQEFTRPESETPPVRESLQGGELITLLPQLPAEGLPATAITAAPINITDTISAPDSSNVSDAASSSKPQGRKGDGTDCRESGDVDIHSGPHTSEVDITIAVPAGQAPGLTRVAGEEGEMDQEKADNKKGEDKSLDSSQNPTEGGPNGGKTDDETVHGAKGGDERVGVEQAVEGNLDERNRNREVAGTANEHLGATDEGNSVEKIGSEKECSERIYIHEKISNQEKAGAEDLAKEHAGDEKSNGENEDKGKVGDEDNQASDEAVSEENSEKANPREKMTDELHLVGGTSPGCADDISKEAGIQQSTSSRVLGGIDDKGEQGGFAVPGGIKMHQLKVGDVNVNPGEHSIAGAGLCAPTDSATTTLKISEPNKTDDGANEDTLDKFSDNVDASVRANPPAEGVCDTKAESRGESSFPPTSQLSHNEKSPRGFEEGFAAETKITQPTVAANRPGTRQSIELLPSSSPTPSQFVQNYSQLPGKGSVTMPTPQDEEQCDMEIGSHPNLGLQYDHPAQVDAQTPSSQRNTSLDQQSDDVDPAAMQVTRGAVIAAGNIHGTANTEVRLEPKPSKIFASSQETLEVEDKPIGPSREQRSKQGNAATVDIDANSVPTLGLILTDQSNMPSITDTSVHGSSVPVKNTEDSVSDGPLESTQEKSTSQENGLPEVGQSLPLTVDQKPSQRIIGNTDIYPQADTSAPTLSLASTSPSQISSKDTQQGQDFLANSDTVSDGTLHALTNARAGVSENSKHTPGISTPALPSIPTNGPINPPPPSPTEISGVSEPTTHKKETPLLEVLTPSTANLPFDSNPSVGENDRISILPILGDTGAEGGVTRLTLKIDPKAGSTSPKVDNVVAGAGTPQAVDGNGYLLTENGLSSPGVQLPSQHADVADQKEINDEKIWTTEHGDEETLSTNQAVLHTGHGRVCAQTGNIFLVDLEVAQNPMTLQSGHAINLEQVDTGFQVHKGQVPMKESTESISSRQSPFVKENDKNISLGQPEVPGEVLKYGPTTSGVHTIGQIIRSIDEPVKDVSLIEDDFGISAPPAALTTEPDVLVRPAGKNLSDISLVPSITQSPIGAGNMSSSHAEIIFPQSGSCDDQVTIAPSSEEQPSQLPSSPEVGTNQPSQNTNSSKGGSAPLGDIGSNHANTDQFSKDRQQKPGATSHKGSTIPGNAVLDVGNEATKAEHELKSGASAVVNFSPHSPEAADVTGRNHHAQSSPDRSFANSQPVEAPHPIIDQEAKSSAFHQGMGAQPLEKVNRQSSSNLHRPASANETSSGSGRLSSYPTNRHTGRGAAHLVGSGGDIHNEDSYSRGNSAASIKTDPLHSSTITPQSATEESRRAKTKSERNMKNSNSFGPWDDKKDDWGESDEQNSGARDNARDFGGRSGIFSFDDDEPEEKQHQSFLSQESDMMRDTSWEDKPGRSSSDGARFRDDFFSLPNANIRSLSRSTSIHNSVPDTQLNSRGHSMGIPELPRSQTSPKGFTPRSSQTTPMTRLEGDMSHAGNGKGVVEMPQGRVAMGDFTNKLMTAAMNTTARSAVDNFVKNKVDSQNPILAQNFDTVAAHINIPQPAPVGRMNVAEMVRIRPEVGRMNVAEMVRIRPDEPSQSPTPFDIPSSVGKLDHEPHAQPGDQAWSGGRHSAVLEISEGSGGVHVVHEKRSPVGFGIKEKDVVLPLRVGEAREVVDERQRVLSPHERHQQNYEQEQEQNQQTLQQNYPHHHHQQSLPPDRQEQYQQRQSQNRQLEQEQEQQQSQKWELGPGEYRQHQNALPGRTNSPIPTSSLNESQPRTPPAQVAPAPYPLESDRVRNVQIPDECSSALFGNVLSNSYEVDEGNTGFASQNSNEDLGTVDVERIVDEQKVREKYSALKAKLKVQMQMELDELKNGEKKQKPKEKSRLMEELKHMKNNRLSSSYPQTQESDVPNIFMPNSPELPDSPVERVDQLTPVHNSTVGVSGKGQMDSFQPFPNLSGQISSASIINNRQGTTQEIAIRQLPFVGIQPPSQAPHTVSPRADQSPQLPVFRLGTAQPSEDLAHSYNSTLANSEVPYPVPNDLAAAPNVPMPQTPYNDAPDRYSQTSPLRLQSPNRDDTLQAENMGPGISVSKNSQEHTFVNFVQGGRHGAESTSAIIGEINYSEDSSLMVAPPSRFEERQSFSPAPLGSNQTTLCAQEPSPDVVIENAPYSFSHSAHPITSSLSEHNDGYGDPGSSVSQSQSQAEALPYPNPTAGENTIEMPVEAVSSGPGFESGVTSFADATSRQGHLTSAATATMPHAPNAAPRTPQSLRILEDQQNSNFSSPVQRGATFFGQQGSVENNTEAQYPENVREGLFMNLRAQGNHALSNHTEQQGHDAGHIPLGVGIGGGASLIGHMPSEVNTNFVLLGLIRTDLGHASTHTYPELLAQNNQMTGANYLSSPGSSAGYPLPIITPQRIDIEGPRVSALMGSTYQNQGRNLSHPAGRQISPNFPPAQSSNNRHASVRSSNSGAVHLTSGISEYGNGNLPQRNERPSADNDVGGLDASNRYIQPASRMQHIPAPTQQPIENPIYPLDVFRNTPPPPYTSPQRGGQPGRNFAEPQTPIRYGIGGVGRDVNSNMSPDYTSSPLGMYSNEHSPGIPNRQNPNRDSGYGGQYSQRSSMYAQNEPGSGYIGTFMRIDSPTERIERDYAPGFSPQRSSLQDNPGFGGYPQFPQFDVARNTGYEGSQTQQQGPSAVQYTEPGDYESSSYTQSPSLMSRNEPARPFSGGGAFSVRIQPEYSSPYESQPPRISYNDQQGIQVNTQIEPQYHGQYGDHRRSTVPESIGIFRHNDSPNEPTRHNYSGPTFSNEVRSAGGYGQRNPVSLPPAQLNFASQSPQFGRSEVPGFVHYSPPNSQIVQNQRVGSAYQDNMPYVSSYNSVYEREERYAPNSGRWEGDRGGEFAPNFEGARREIGGSGGVVYPDGRRRTDLAMPDGNVYGSGYVCP